MAWNSYLTENGWNTPRFGEWAILKSDLQYASSFSNLTYDQDMGWSTLSGPGESHITDFNVINDNRYPIYLLLFDSNGEPYNNRLSGISPLYSSQCHMHIIINSVDYYDGDVNISQYPLDEIASGYPGSYPFSYPTETLYGEIVTNMPIIACDYDYFTTEGIDLSALRANYLNNGDLSIFDEYIADEHMRILNEAEAPEPDSEYFTIYNTGQKDVWTKAGRNYVSGPYYRWCKIKMLSTASVDGRLAFYRQGLNDGKIKLVPVSVADVVSCEYSTDGANWQSSDSFPFDYIYGERINELGEFISATRTGIGGDTGVPCFATETEATKWVNHDPSVDISDALNYEDIANRYGITNPTGAKEVATTMGDGGASLRGYFSHDYIMSYGSVAEISDAFFDVGPQGIWESIKDGIEMMGANPIDCIAGLWNLRFWGTMHRGVSAPSCCAFIHRLKVCTSCRLPTSI